MCTMGIDEKTFDRWLAASKNPDAQLAVGGELKTPYEQKEFIVASAIRLGLYDESSQSLTPQAQAIVNKYYPGLF